LYVFQINMFLSEYFSSVPEIPITNLVFSSMACVHLDDSTGGCGGTRHVHASPIVLPVAHILYVEPRISSVNQVEPLAGTPIALPLDQRDYGGQSIYFKTATKVGDLGKKMQSGSQMVVWLGR
jgi:hypothetical protein